jgi:1,4-alpha-glucan branching enzyme
MAMLLLAPSVPLVFMGEEFAATTPFLYFCDFKGDLADAVREGRRKEFAAFEKFSISPGRGPGRGSQEIPDPNDQQTFLSSQLDWASLLCKDNAASFEHFRALLKLRATHIVPRLAKGEAHGKYAFSAPGMVAVDWTLGDGSGLWMRANLADTANECWVPNARLLHVEGSAPVTPAAKVAPAAPVTPAKAGAQGNWTPAFAGVTKDAGATSGASVTRIAPWSAAWWVA